jgi:hypothetical protein
LKKKPLGVKDQRYLKKVDELLEMFDKEVKENESR